jgi:hypothetical protein|nr:MAG TPA: hypothetical protein [Caudoviricetes sp.]
MNIIYEVMPEDFSEEGIKKALLEKRRLEQEAQKSSEEISEED